MIDYKRLKHLALAQPVQEWRSEEGEPSMMTSERMYHVIGPGGVSCWEHGAHDRVSASYIAAASPAVVLELIAENEAMAKRVMTIDIVHGPKAELRWIALAAERDALKAECEGLRADAERYQWLCEKFGITKLPCAVERILSGDIYVADGKSGVDCAIDAAMRKESGQ
ncbi:hypothetical protein ACTUVN_002658 [Pseudomonas caspiana]